MFVLAAFVTQLVRGTSNQLINGIAKLVCDDGGFGEFELIFSLPTAAVCTLAAWTSCFWVSPWAARSPFNRSCMVAVSVCVGVGSRS